MQDKAISNEVLARIYGAYLGSPIQYQDTEGKTVIATLTGVSRADGLETTWDKKKDGCVGDYLSFKANGRHDCDALHAKLILRPLSDITDEHAKQVAELMSSLEYGELDPDTISDWFNDIWIGNSALMSDYVDGRQLQGLIDFLRSLGYDLGYGSIPSLIQAGIATKKEGGNG